jgi:hypothetical protein
MPISGAEALFFAKDWDIGGSWKLRRWLKRVILFSKPSACHQ